MPFPVCLPVLLMKAKKDVIMGYVLWAMDLHDDHSTMHSLVTDWIPRSFFFPFKKSPPLREAKDVETKKKDGEKPVLKKKER